MSVACRDGDGVDDPGGRLHWPFQFPPRRRWYVHSKARLCTPPPATTATPVRPPVAEPWTR